MIKTDNERKQNWKKKEKQHYGNDKLKAHELNTHLEKVDNRKPILDVRSHVVHAEVEPLDMFVGVQIISKPKLIVMVTPEASKHQA